MLSTSRRILIPRLRSLATFPAFSCLVCSHSLALGLTFRYPVVSPTTRSPLNYPYQTCASSWSAAARRCPVGQSSCSAFFRTVFRWMRG
eukprot:7140906-Alexandrium_andersonii.AAC.1